MASSKTIQWSLSAKVHLTPTRRSSTNSGKPIEFVLIGQDSRDGEENQSVGGNFDDVVGNHQADTTMVAQISADRTKINLVPFHAIPWWTCLSARQPMVRFPRNTT